jgi:hypothetical protein
VILVDCLHLRRGEQANLLQFLVGEVRLFLIAGPLYLAQSRFLRDTAELRFWHAEQEGSPCLRDVFRDLIVHNPPLTVMDRSTDSWTGVSGTVQREVMHPFANASY